MFRSVFVVIETSVYSYNALCSAVSTTYGYYLLFGYGDKRLRYRTMYNGTWNNESVIVQ